VLLSTQVLRMALKDMHRAKSILDSPDALSARSALLGFGAKEIAPFSLTIVFICQV